MKKTRLLTVLMVSTLLMASCGKKGDSQGNSDAQGDSTQTTATAEGSGSTQDPYTHYNNTKYGFSVDVPRQMTCTDDPQMAEGANFALGDDIMNLLSVFASESYGGKPFTPEEIKGELDERAASLGDEPGATIEKKEEANGWTLTIRGGEMYHQVYSTRYKDGKRFELSFIYSKEQEGALGGDVERHIFDSWKVN